QLVEEALRERVFDAQAVIDGIPGIIIVMKPDGSVETTNRQNLDYLGMAAEDLKNCGMNGIVHPDDLPRVHSEFAPSIATGSPFQFELRMRRHDGVYRWFMARGVAVRDSKGAVA